MKNAQKALKKHLDLGQILYQARRFDYQPCIYYLIDSNDEVIYVGQTKNLYSQPSLHIVGLVEAFKRLSSTRSAHTTGPTALSGCGHQFKDQTNSAV